MLKRERRFRWIFMGGDVGYIMNSITPVGNVDTPADLAALRAILESADPPMPLDLQYVSVRSPDAASRPAR